MNRYRKKKSKIAEFSIRSIINAKKDATVRPKWLSNNKFYAWFENNFAITSNGQHVIGANSQEFKSVIIEEITHDHSTSRTVFGNHKGTITTVLPFEDLDTLLVGDWNNNVVQYQRESSGSWKVSKDYEDIGISDINASSRVGNMAVFGGDDYCLRVIDVAKRKVVGGSYRTAIKWIYSLQVCQVSSHKTIVFVGGCNPDDSKSKSDLLEISKCVMSLIRSVKGVTRCPHPISKTKGD